MKLFWTPEAIEDRRAIYDCIQADNPSAALALDELIEEKANRLIDHPGLGRPGRVAGTRELAHRRLSIIALSSAIRDKSTVAQKSWIWNIQPYKSMVIYVVRR